MQVAPFTWQRLFGGRSVDAPVLAGKVVGALPVLAIDGTVSFPGAVLPLQLSAPEDLRALEAAVETDSILLLVPRDAAGLLRSGVAATVVQSESTAGTVTVLVHGFERRTVTSFEQTQGCLSALTEAAPTARANLANLAEATRSLRVTAMRYARCEPTFFARASETIAATEAAEHLADYVIANLPLEVARKEALLSQVDLLAKLCATEDVLRELQAGRRAEGEPECPEHGLVASSTCSRCSRCGAFVCARCLGSKPGTTTCQACRKLAMQARPQPSAFLGLFVTLVIAVFPLFYPLPRWGLVMFFALGIRSAFIQGRHAWRQYRVGAPNRLAIVLTAAYSCALVLLSLRIYGLW